MKKTVAIFLSIVAFIIPQIAFPQWTVYNTSNSSIPFNKIFALETDKYNNVWCGNDNSGSFNHVTKFNGSTWTSSYPTNWVNDIDSDTSGNVWILTSNNELKSWNGTAWNTYTNPLLGYPWAAPLKCDNNGNKWIVNDSSIIKYNGSTWTAYHPASYGFPDNYISSIETDTAQGIWLAMRDSGLLHFNGISTWNLYNTSNSSIPDSRIYSVKAGMDDTLWLVSGNNLVAYANNNFSTVSTYSLLVNSGEMNIDNKGNIWLISNGNGLLKYDRSAWTQFNTGNTPALGTNQLLSLAIDTADNVWVGTWGSGLVKYSQGTAGIAGGKKEKITIETYPNPIGEKLVVKSNFKIDQLKIYNVLGIEMLSVTNDAAGEFQIDLTPYPGGVYNVVAIIGQERVSRKIINE